MTMTHLAPRPAHEFDRAAGKPQRRRKRPSPITFRLTDDERERLKNLSEGMPVSAYIRACVFGENVARRKRRSYTPVADQKAMAKALAMLGATRIANNLNQLAYHANAGSLLVDDDTLGKIEEAYGHVCSMRAALINALGLQADPNRR